MAADPKQAVHQAFMYNGNVLSTPTKQYDLNAYRNIYILSAGKAALSMAEAVGEILGERISRGCVVTTHGTKGILRNLTIFEGGHPVPDQEGGEGAKECLEQARTANADDLVLVLLSGGASALLPCPSPGISLRDKRLVTEQLLRCGAPINEVNTVRKHLSCIKGGRLAAEIHPATSITLILSDVLNGDLSTVASGPTVPDPSTFSQAISIFKRYNLWSRAPKMVKRSLERGSKGKSPETPKPGDPIFERAESFIVSDNRPAVQAAEDKARLLGFQVLVLSTSLQGEAREVARVFGAMAWEIHRSGRPLSRPACILAGGELTVAVKGRGLGGRAQEFALAAALQINRLPETIIAGFGTDGLDGPTVAAGAWAGGTTLKRAEEAGLSAVQHLMDNNAFGFFKPLRDLIVTGPTGTNVNDLYVLLMA